MTKKKLITSALPYVNNVPHLGNIIGCVLSADVYARFCRSMGYETLYICATDEYGTATQNKAREEGLSPKEVCDKYHEIHKEVYEHFNIQFDHFGRTSIPEQTEIVQTIYKQLNDKKLIFEQEDEQTYCEKDKIFLADRFIEGTCPSCDYEDARGDQCDQCGKLLQPTELKQAKCKICGTPPITKKTTHLYLDLPKISERLQTFQDKSLKDGFWSKNAQGETKKWMKAGINARPITRDLKWGVPVPKKGFEDKVFYVWFDAPIGYLSNTKQAVGDDWVKWWKDPENTELYQFMAKDNIPFHTVIFPSSLIGTGEDWTLLHHISSTEYLNYENEKFSKSRNIGVFGTDVMASEIPVDLWRYYLLHNRPEKSDSNFYWESFFEDSNSNFIDNIGNLVNRALLFLHKNFDGELKGTSVDQNHSFLSLIKEKEKNIIELLEHVQIKEALNQILALGREGNRFFQESEPWKLIKEDKEKTKEILYILCCLIQDLGIMLEPYMPATSKKIFHSLNIQNKTFQDLSSWSEISFIKIEKPELLYKKLDLKQASILKEKFSGDKQEEVIVKDPIEFWKKIEIKVGKVIEVEMHPSADRLYVEKIDVGESEPRTIVSGLVKYISKEDFINKKVLVATNLKSANLRGVDSSGMVLTAEKRKKLELLELEFAKVGSIVKLENEETPTKETQIEIDDFFDADLSIKENEIFCGDQRLVIDNQLITTKIVANGKVK